MLVHVGPWALAHVRSAEGRRTASVLNSLEAFLEQRPDEIPENGVVAAGPLNDFVAQATSPRTRRRKERAREEKRSALSDSQKMRLQASRSVDPSARTETPVRPVSVSIVDPSSPTRQPSLLTLDSELDMKALLKLAIESGDIPRNPYKTVPAPMPPSPLSDTAAVHRATLASLLDDGDPRALFRDSHLISTGAFSAVYAAERLSDGLPVALKKIVRSQIDPGDLLAEVEVLKSLSHPNLVACYGAYEAAEGRELWIAMERMSDVTLETVALLFPQQPLDEPKIAYVCFEMLKGLAYMHMHHRVHRDVKSSNVLLNAAGDVKLADFGFVVELTLEKSKRRSSVGTSYWEAPEVIAGEAYDTSC
ncbi:MAG TPA: protein kinase, partial [archaeon]|nr:protein kinase [archaeon]